MAVTEVTLEVDSLEGLNKIIRELRKIDSVYEVKRKKQGRERTGPKRTLFKRDPVPNELVPNEQVAKMIKERNL